MSRSLEDLDARFLYLANRLIQSAQLQGVPVTVINTLRTPAEQKRNIELGVSWTKHSRHLPQAPDGKALAMDVAPTELLNRAAAEIAAGHPTRQAIYWYPDDPLWQRLGAIGEALGLIWGGRWPRKRDMGHFEMRTM